MLAVTARSTPIFTWILVGGVPDVDGEHGGIGGLQFGIQYEPTVEVWVWTLCTGGSEIPQDDVDGVWPESGTGNAVTWYDGCYTVTENYDGLTRVGFFTMYPGSHGGIRIMNDPRIGQGEALDCAGHEIRLCRSLYGKAVLHPDDGLCYQYNYGPYWQNCLPCGHKCAIPVLKSRHHSKDTSA